MFEWKETVELYKDRLIELNKIAGKSILKNYTKGSIRNCEAHTLYSLIRKNNYKNILEIGTGNGFATLYFGLALRDEKIKGIVDTIDIIDRNSQHDLQNLFKKFKIKKYIKCLIGDSSKVVPTLDKKYDLILIDGSHTFEQTEKDLQNVWTKVSDNGCIVFHDIYRKPPEMKGPRNVLKQELGEIFYFPIELFDYFSYEDDLKDYERMRMKWLANKIADKNSNPKQLMAILWKK